MFHAAISAEDLALAVDVSKGEQNVDGGFFRRYNFLPGNEVGGRPKMFVSENTVALSNKLLRVRLNAEAIAKVLAPR